MNSRRQDSLAPAPRRSGRFPLVSALVTAVLISPAIAFAAPDDAGRRAEVAVGAGYLYRQAASDASGVRYGGDLALDVQARAYAARWLRVSACFQRGHSSVDVPSGAAGIAYDSLELGSALSYSLGARLEPTWHVTDRFRASLILGVAWGRLQVPTMTVHEAGAQYRVKPRSGSFLEYPLGVGVAVDILPNRLSVSFESTVAPHTAQSGELFGTVQYTNDHGKLGHVQAMPQLHLSIANMLHLVLAL